MAGDLIAATTKVLETGNGVRNIPSLVAKAGGGAQKRFIEFFAAQIRPVLQILRRFGQKTPSSLPVYFFCRMEDGV